MRLTEEQQDIRQTGSEAVKRGDNLGVLAFAGAGKTTTLKSLAEAISMRGCYLAFNKSIAEEAKRKLVRSRCTAATMHSLAFGAVRDITSSPATLNARDFRDSGILTRVHVPRVRSWNPYRLSSAVVRTLAAFCNSDDSDIGIHHAEEAIMSSTGDPDLLHVEEKAEQAREAIRVLAGPLTDMAVMYWRDNVENGRFSHDIYLKLLDLDEGLRADAFRGFRYLRGDEAQDSNPVQHSILMKSGLPLIAVGDPYQQIYSWRGAENALAKLSGEVRYLTQSFRFGEDIAETARIILASRPDGGPEQRLIGAGQGIPADYRGPKAAIICRTNIGMIDEAIRVMRTGRKVSVDNVESLVADVKSAEALQCGELNRVTSPEIKQFDSWDEMIAEAEEGGGALARLVQLVENNRVSEVESLLRHNTRPADADILICTAHRSKGLEFPAVVLGGDWKDIDAMRRRYKVAQRETAKHITLAVEEWNALYVASTRPFKRLQGIEKIMSTEREADMDFGDYTPPDWEAIDRQADPT